MINGRISPRKPKIFAFQNATLSDERRSLFIWIKEPCVRKFEGLERSKLRGISQTRMANLQCEVVVYLGFYLGKENYFQLKDGFTRGSVSGQGFVFKDVFFVFGSS